MNSVRACSTRCLGRYAIVPVSLILAVAFGLLADAAGDPPAQANRAKVLVLTGNEYPGHKWQETAPLLAEFLAVDPRLATSVNKDPGFLASPKLLDYDVMVLNYMNWHSPDPGEEARANLKRFVESGKGLVLVHFACGAFQGWPEFANIAGRIYNPKLRGHDPYGKFTVEIVDAAHPITKGLQPFETSDELYTCLAGNQDIHVLATATSKVDKKDYPMAFVHDYGKGRVFHCVLGHDVKALSVAAVQELYRRGTAWAARLEPAAQAEKTH
jgi:type 1 glutamine amidotransferase